MLYYYLDVYLIEYYQDIEILPALAQCIVSTHCETHGEIIVWFGLLLTLAVARKHFILSS